MPDTNLLSLQKSSGTRISSRATPMTRGQCYSGLCKWNVTCWTLTLDIGNLTYLYYVCILRLCRYTFGSFTFSTQNPAPLYILPPDAEMIKKGIARKASLTDFTWRNKTQVGPPLRTRAIRRKENREKRKREEQAKQEKRRKLEEEDDDEYND